MEHVETLLKKLNEGKITLPEKEDLLKYFEEEEENEKTIKAFLYKQWDKGEANARYNSANVYESIRSKLNLPPASSKHHIIQYLNRRYYLQVLKYAAIVLFTFLISSLFFHENGDEHVAGGADVKFIVEHGSKGTVVLPDGSKVWLNSGSELSYPPDLSYDGKRLVTLRGEAFFDIRENKENPFYIRAKQINIKVLGTRFNIKSYPDETNVEATLVSGEILLYKNQGEEKAVRLNRPHQQAIIKSEPSNKNLTGTTKPGKTIPANPAKTERTGIKVDQLEEPSLVTSWKEGQLKFKEENFENLSRRLERWYNVNIHFNNERLKDVTFTGTFEKESIEQVLHALSLSYPFNYEFNKNEIFVGSN